MSRVICVWPAKVDTANMPAATSAQRMLRRSIAGCSAQKTNGIQTATANML